MPTISQQTQQLQQDIQNELFSANHLNQLILNELQEIKHFTNPGGEFETTIKQNAILVSKLANLQKIDLENITVNQRNHTDMSTQITEEQNESEMNIDH